MAEHKQYELASAYVAILPSLEGLSKELKSQLDAAMPSMGKSLSNGLNSAMSGAAKGFSNILGKSGSLFAGAGKALGSTLTSAVVSTGKTFQEVMSVGAKAAGGALSASIAAVGAQVVGGGLSRALGLNEAESKLQALGYNAQKMQEVMTAAANAVDGTAYAMNESVNSATQFIAAGITNGSDLESVLKNVGKLADISGRSFSDMGAIMSKNASAGIVQWEDMVQLINSGVPIQSYLAKQMGKSTAEIRKMASAGKITFEDFNKAVSGIDFDSAVYAAMNVQLAFKNVRAQLSKIGANLWEPIIDGLGPILVRVREGLVSLQKMPVFNDLMNKIQTSFSGGMEKIKKTIDGVVSVLENAGKSQDVFSKLTDNFKKFRSAITGIEGPLLGVGAAIGSGFLSQLPIVGRLFGRVSIGAGLMGGTLIQAYNSSEDLQNALGGLKDTLKNVLSGFKGFNNADWSKSLGDSIAGVVDAISGAFSKIDLSKIADLDLSGIFSSIFGNITDFINTISENGGRISDAIKDIIGTVSETVKNISGDQDVSVGDWIGEVVVKGIEIAADAIEFVAPILEGAVKALTKVVNSDITKGILGWLADAAEWIASKEDLLIGLGATLATLFVAGKLSGPLTAMVGFFKGFKGTGAAGAGAGLTATITSLGTAGTALLTATPGILAGILGLVAIGLAITAALGAFELVGGFELLKIVLDRVYFLLTDFSVFLKDMFYQIIDTIAYGITQISGALGISGEDIVPFLTELADNFVQILGMISENIRTVVKEIGDVVTEIIDFLKDLIPNTVKLLTTLAEDGLTAGAGALAAAGGITALAASLALLGGGSLLAELGSGLGSLWTGFTSWVTGDDTSAAGKLGEMADAINKFDGNIEKMPETWMFIGEKAYASGSLIIQDFGRGMLDGLVTVQQQIIDGIMAMIATIQAQINTVPLELSVNTPNLAGGSGNTYNSTTNFDVSVNNSSVTKSLARSAR